MFMYIEVSQGFLIDTIDPIQLLRSYFELNSGLGQIPVKFTMEVSRVYHELIVLFRLLPEIPLG